MLHIYGHMVLQSQLNFSYVCFSYVSYVKDTLSMREGEVEDLHNVLRVEEDGGGKSEEDPIYFRPE